MKNPHTEMTDEKIDIKTVVMRHDASLIVSPTESSIQVIFQWGSFLGLIYLIDKVMYEIKQTSKNSAQTSQLLFTFKKKTQAFMESYVNWMKQ